MLLSALAAMSNFPAHMHLSRFLCVSDGDDLCRYIASVFVAIFISPFEFLTAYFRRVVVQSSAATRSHAYNTKASACCRWDRHELLVQLGHQYHELTVGLNFREEGASCLCWPRSKFS